jgi:tetratricopeptide (TPR) repeat protein
MPGAWSKTPGDWFSGEFQWDIGQSKRFDVTWRQIGRWGVHRIRAVRYATPSSPFATLILVEGSRDIFSPLMKWSGQMPETVTYDHDGSQVLVLQKDFGGNVPMVSTWAWIWGIDGPIRLDVDGAVSEAIEKVVPGYAGYQTGLDWLKLHCQTWVWKGDYPGKVGVADTFEAWFELGPEGLVLQRANFGDEFGGRPRTIRWPRTPPGLASAEQVSGRPGQPFRTEVALKFRDFRGTPVPALEVRFKGGASATTDSLGTASVPLPSSLPEGTPLLLELINPSQPFVVISPCRGVIPVSQSGGTVVVAHMGDPSILVGPVSLESFADCILRTAPPQEKYEWALYGRRRRQALQTVAHSVGVTPAALDLAIHTWGRTVNDAFSRGLIALYEQRPGDAATELRKAIRALAGPATSQMPVDQDKLAKAEFYLGRALYAQRHFAESIAAYERSAAIWPNDSALRMSWGWSLWELRDFAGAEFHLRRALSIEEGLFGTNAEGVGVLSKYLAGALYSKPDYTEIEVLDRRALAIAEQTAGVDSADYAEALHNLAILAIVNLDSASAKTLFQRALGIRQRKLGPYDRETAETIEELGMLLYHQRDSCPDALPLFRKALGIREKAFGPLHPATARSVNAVGLCLEETGDLEMAEEYYRRAVSIMDRTLGEDQSITADFMSNLASLLATHQRVPESEQLQRHALAIQEAILEPDHPDLIDTLWKLAFLLAANGGLQEAERLLYRATSIRERVSGPNNSDLASLLSDLAAILLNEGKNSEAEPLLRRALDIRERTVGPNHKDTAKSLNDLAILLDRKGEAEQSASLFQRALAIYRNALGQQSPEARSVEKLLDEVEKKLSR